jgi:lipopolysaccharide export system protein LptA
MLGTKQGRSARIRKPETRAFIPVGRSAAASRVLCLAACLFCLSAFSSAQVEPGGEVKVEGPKVTYYPDGRIEGSGGVKVTYEDITLTADSVEGNVDEEWFSLSGNVTLDQRGQKATGETLFIDLAERRWSLKQAKSDLTPEYLEGQVVSPIFTKGAEVIGERDRGIVKGGSFTTCDLPNPHYRIESQSITIYPNKKLIARHVAIFVGKKRLLSVGSFVLPLRRKGERPPFVPELGRSEDEGFYIKNSYNYLIRGETYGTLKLDWMQRKGWGYGIEQDYKFAKQAGTLLLYTLRDRETGARAVTSTLDHSGKLGSYDLRLREDVRKRSYLYASSTTTKTTNLNLSGGGPKGRTNFTFSDRRTVGPFSSSSQTSSLQRTAKLGENTNLRVDLSYSSWGSGTEGVPPDKELWNKVTLDTSWQRWDAQIAYQDRFDVDREKNTQDDTRFAFERLPELIFKTDTSRTGWRLFGRGRANFSLSLGRFAERPSGVSTERALIDTDFSIPSRKLLGSSTFSFHGGFTQGIYGDNTAQWVANGRTQIAVPISGAVRFSLSHRFQKHRGYAPFVVDQESKRNILSGDLEFGSRNSKYGLAAGSGYDFTRDDYNWQTLSLRTWGKPTEWFEYEASTGYDLNRAVWRPLLLKLDVSREPSLSAEIGVRYDLDTRKLVQARGVFDASIARKWRIQAMLGYDGTSKEFDYRDIMLTRDLHCWEASLSLIDEAGYRQRKTVMLELRLKALPAPRRFGTSSSGSAFDSSVGWGY